MAKMTARVKINTNLAGFVTIDRMLKRARNSIKKLIPKQARALVYIFSSGKTEKIFSNLVLG